MMLKFGWVLNLLIGMAARRSYELGPALHPLFGREVLNFQIADRNFGDPQLVQTLKADLDAHKLLLFRNQGQIQGATQVEFSQLLGTIESTFHRHPRSPHLDIFRVSNNPREGCTQVGRSGWHIDGTFLETPFAYQLMHFHSVNAAGGTLFLPLRDFWESRSPALKDDWQSLFFLTSRRGQVGHKLVSEHPRTGEPTLIFHTGDPFCDGFLRQEAGHPIYQPKEPILAQLIQEIDRSPQLVLDMQWREGDLAVVDNRALAHYAKPETQALDGLRILHRTTVL